MQPLSLGQMPMNDRAKPVYTQGMKPLPAPNIPGKTEFERFDNALRQVLSVSKEDLLKMEAREKRKKERKKQRKPR